MFQVFVWIALLILSVFILVRGSEMFVIGAKKVGHTAGMSAFAIGVLIVGFGTSIPELASSISAAIHGTTAIVAANVIGSNIANILFIIGLIASIGGTVILRREAVRDELPFFGISTILFVMVIYDSAVNRMESFLLLGVFVSYLVHLFTRSGKDRTKHIAKARGHHKTSDFQAIVFLVLGIAAVLLGANYAIDMVINIATFLDVPLSLISITAIALSTSLPELSVALQALRHKEADIAVGSIFGSNAFNALVVVGIPGLIAPLAVDSIAISVGLPIFIASSIALFLCGVAGRIMRWEGVAFLFFFAYFLVQLATY